MFLFIFLVFFILPLYFLPTFMAGHTKHPKIGLILVLNILFGWTGIGWLILLGYASQKKELTSNH